MPKSEMSDSWPARFPGFCILCQTRFPAGTLVVHVPQDGVLHAECPDPLAPSQDICPKHFIEVSVTGECPECA